MIKPYEAGIVAMRRGIKPAHALKQLLVRCINLHKTPLGFIAVTQAAVLFAVLLALYLARVFGKLQTPRPC